MLVSTTGKIKLFPENNKKLFFVFLALSKFNITFLFMSILPTRFKFKFRLPYHKRYQGYHISFFTQIEILFAFNQLDHC